MATPAFRFLGPKCLESFSTPFFLSHLTPVQRHILPPLITYAEPSPLFFPATCMPCPGCCGDLRISFLLLLYTAVSCSPRSSQHCCRKPTSVLWSQNRTRGQRLGVKRNEFYYFKAKEVRAGLQSCRPAWGKRLIRVVVARNLVRAAGHVPHAFKEIS